MLTSYLAPSQCSFVDVSSSMLTRQSCTVNFIVVHCKILLQCTFIKFSCCKTNVYSEMIKYTLCIVHSIVPLYNCLDCFVCLSLFSPTPPSFLSSPYSPSGPVSPKVIINNKLKGLMQQVDLVLSGSHHLLLVPPLQNKSVRHFEGNNFHIKDQSIKK